MSLREMTFENWDSIHEVPLGAMVDEGTKILAFILLTAKKLAARAQRGMLGEHEVWVVNTPVEFVAETAEVLKSKEPHLPILGWMFDGERGNYYCSLRSRKDGSDVSLIAKQFGGGGHRNAAGFRTSTPPVGGSSTGMLKPEGWQLPDISAALAAAGELPPIAHAMSERPNWPRPTCPICGKPTFGWFEERRRRFFSCDLWTTALYVRYRCADHREATVTL